MRRSPSWLTGRPIGKQKLFSKILTVRRGALVDVGANCGQTLVDYFRSASTTGYVGFEPNYHCVRVINDIITTNACSDCSLIPVALSDESGNSEAASCQRSAHRFLGEH